jgi:hypothetical protein
MGVRFADPMTLTDEQIDEMIRESSASTGVIIYDSDPIEYF